jgi:hypothetical protein
VIAAVDLDRRLAVDHRGDDVTVFGDRCAPNCVGYPTA